MSMNSSPPPGWFPDPDHAGWQRWWDGQQWADYWIEGSLPPGETFPDPTAGIGGTGEQPVQQGYASPTEQPAYDQSMMAQQPVAQPAGEQYIAPYDPANTGNFGAQGQGVPAQGLQGQTGSYPAAPGGAQGTGGGSSRGLVIGLVAAGVVLVLVLGIGTLMWMRGDDSVATDDPTTSTVEGGDDPSGAEPGKGPNILAACEVQEPESIPGTDIEVDPISVGEEEAVGVDVRADVLSQIEESSDTGAKDKLTEILEKIKPADTPYKFNVTVLESEDVNAFVIPGGDIFFTTAIISMMNDDELAFVMAHEISHELCHHLAKKMQQQELIMAGAEAVTGSIDADPEAVAEIAGALFTVGILIGGYTRADETEADLAGLELILKTDYPPEAGVTGLQKLADIQATDTADTLPEFLSTHPLTQKRIDQLQAEIDALDE